jgi:histidinol-phosphate aminotransferase
MPRAKQHLKKIMRSSQRPRKSFLRLDMNEGIPGLPAHFIRKTTGKIGQELLSTYPEYENLITKVAKHDNLKLQNICLSNGSDAAIKYIFDAYVSAGDKILITNPTFAMYPVYCKLFKADPVVVNYGQDLAFPLRDFKKNLTAGIKMAVLVNPNNPIGSALEISEIVSIVKQAAKHNILILIDEAYFYFYPQTAIKYVNTFKNLIVLRTFSKLLGMASVRLGYAAAHPRIIENLIKVKPTFDVNGVAVLFGEAILDHPGIIAKLIKSAEEGRSFLINKLKNWKITFINGKANFILIKTGKKTNKTISMLAHNKILVGGDFEQPFLKDYIRVTIGAKPQMEKFWKVFIKCLNRL